MIVKGKRKAEFLLGKKLSDPKYTGKKYFVLSETGERLFGGYKTEKEAKKRLGQVEFFKRRGNPGLPGGLADARSAADFDAKALRKGIKVEMEHTNDPKLAQEIAADHLVEHPGYYDALEKMERELEGNPGGLAKDVKKLLKAAEKQGCVVLKGRKHYKIRCPQGRQFTVAASPSDSRAIHRIKRDFRNIAGIEMNPSGSPVPNPEVFFVGEEFDTGKRKWVVEKVNWNSDSKFGLRAPDWTREAYVLDLSGGDEPRYHVLIRFSGSGEADVTLEEPNVLGSHPESYGSYMTPGYHPIGFTSIPFEDGGRNQTVWDALAYADQVIDAQESGTPYRKANPRKVLYIKPNKAAVKAAKRGLEAREKAPKSKKGGLDAMQAKEEGVGSGVLRARDIIAGKRVNAYQIKAFFDRHRGNYLKAKDKKLKPEDSRAIQAWLIWGGDPLYRQAKAAVGKDRKKRAKNPMPVPLSNPKKFWDKEHNWKEVLISKAGRRKTRKQILDYYQKNAEKIWPYLKGQTVMVILATGRNKFVLRRKGPDGSYIKLTKLKGIDDPHSFEYWIHRRVIEFHPVITGKTTGLIWVDIDPYRKAREKSMAKMQRQIRKAIPLMKRMLKDEFGVTRPYVWRSGKKDGGWHIEGDLPRKMNVDKLRRKLRAALDDYFADDAAFTTTIAKPGQVRLDTTLTKTLGSLRAPYSYTVDGAQKLPVSVPGMAKPLKKKRRAKKNPELTEAQYEQAKVEAEARRRPDVDHLELGGSRLSYEIKLPGREPFIFKADQGSKGTELQTQAEVENILKGSYLFPEMYDYDRVGYRWVEVEKLKPFKSDADSRSQFKRFTGIDWKDFDTVEGIPIRPTESEVAPAREFLVKSDKSEEFFNEVVRLWGLGLSPWEMTVIENWGTTLDGKSLKYLDVGA